MATFKKFNKDRRPKRNTQSLLFKRKRFCRFTVAGVEEIDCVVDGVRTVLSGPARARFPGLGRAGCRGAGPRSGLGVRLRRGGVGQPKRVRSTVFQTLRSRSMAGV